MSALAHIHITTGDHQTVEHHVGCAANVDDAPVFLPVEDCAPSILSANGDVHPDDEHIVIGARLTAISRVGTVREHELVAGGRIRQRRLQRAVAGLYDGHHEPSLGLPSAVVPGRTVGAPCHPASLRAPTVRRVGWWRCGRERVRAFCKDVAVQWRRDGPGQRAIPASIGTLVTSCHERKASGAHLTRDGNVHTRAARSQVNNHSQQAGEIGS